MTDRDPTHLDYSTFPPAMLMNVTAVAVQLHDTLGDADADTWRKTLEVFASGLRLQVDLLPAQGHALCLHISSSAGVGLQRKAMVLNWLSLSRQVHALRVLEPSRRVALGLTIFVDRKNADPKNTVLLVA
jgi:hypothetical protein